jgi:heptosyltransferase-1
MRILLIKTSSLGDVVHNLPVVTDLRAQFPGAEIDWVVEEGFADIPRLHPAVRRVIPVAVRRWRRSLLNPATWREIGELRQTLQGRKLRPGIDTQGWLKSA